MTKAAHAISVAGIADVVNFSQERLLRKCAVPFAAKTRTVRVTKQANALAIGDYVSILHGSAVRAWPWRGAPNELIGDKAFAFIARFESHRISPVQW
jgi:hypothetical protein